VTGDAAVASPARRLRSRSLETNAVGWPDLEASQVVAAIVTKLGTNSGSEAGRLIMSQRKSLGSVIRRIRFERDWTLAQMSAATGIPLSTLARIERDQGSLTYDKLLELSERLEISLLELFSMPEVPRAPGATGRRSISSDANTVTVSSRNYDDNYLCSDLRTKVMTPIIVDVKAGSLEEFGPLTVHEGEEFIYVISGSIVVHTAFYEPTQIDAGRAHYLDSQMGHAYVRAKGCESAQILTICANKTAGLEYLGKSGLLAQPPGEQVTEGAEQPPQPVALCEKRGQSKSSSRSHGNRLTARNRGRPARR
jgi:transcriptional regulator with XRE-family HTH domain